MSQIFIAQENKKGNKIFGRRFDAEDRQEEDWLEKEKIFRSDIRYSLFYIDHSQEVKNIAMSISSKEYNSFM